jgi:hypothetical protein
MRTTYGRLDIGIMQVVFVTSVYSFAAADNKYRGDIRSVSPIRFILRVTSYTYGLPMVLAVAASIIFCASSSSKNLS